MFKGKEIFAKLDPDCCSNQRLLSDIDFGERIFLMKRAGFFNDIAAEKYNSKICDNHLQAFQSAYDKYQKKHSVCLYPRHGLKTRYKTQRSTIPIEESLSRRMSEDNIIVPFGLLGTISVISMLKNV